MTPFGFLNHLLNFAAPALAVALLLALGMRIFIRNRPPALLLLAQAAINLIAGLVVLLAGLALTGHDGRIGTYAALVIVCGTVQWGLVRGWRR